MQLIFRWLLKNKKWTVRVAIIWTVLIFVACLIPGNEIPDVKIPLADKWVHCIIFAGFSFLWLCVKHHSTTLFGLLMFLISVATGYSVELLQGSGITRGRSYDLNDVLADAIGSVTGIMIFFIIQYMYEKKSVTFK